MADAPFRKLFLDKVEARLQKEPSQQALIELLQEATPGFLLDGDVDVNKQPLNPSTLSTTAKDNDALQKSLKKLITKLHPDRHPNESDRSTRLCQDAKEFIDRALEAVASPVTTTTAKQPHPNDNPDNGPPKKRSKTSSSSPVSVRFPFDYCVFDKWPYLRDVCKYPFVDASKGPLNNLTFMPKLVAYQCINLRGAIQHGKMPGLFHGTKVSQGPAESVQSVFDRKGGFKHLTTVDQIKEELQLHGPVVSESFRPSEAFLQQARQKGLLLAPIQGECVVVGWKLAEQGEVWLLQPLQTLHSPSPPVLAVAMGQFGVDDSCVAPISSFENEPWEPGPYLDIDIEGTDPNWRTEWEGMQSCVNLSQLNALFRQMGSLDFGGEKPMITLRDKDIHSHSRQGRLEKMEPENDEEWKVTIVFTN